MLNYLGIASENKYHAASARAIPSCGDDHMIHDGLWGTQPLERECFVISPIRRAKGLSPEFRKSAAAMRSVGTCWSCSFKRETVRQASIVTALLV